MSGQFDSCTCASLCSGKSAALLPECNWHLLYSSSRQQTYHRPSPAAEANGEGQRHLKRRTFPLDCSMRSRDHVTPPPCRYMAFRFDAVVCVQFLTLSTRSTRRCGRFTREAHSSWMRAGPYSSTMASSPHAGDYPLQPCCCGPRECTLIADTMASWRTTTQKAGQGRMGGQADGAAGYDRSTTHRGSR